MRDSKEFVRGVDDLDADLAEDVSDAFVCALYSYHLHVAESLATQESLIQVMHEYYPKTRGNSKEARSERLKRCTIAVKEEFSDSLCGSDSKNAE